MSLCIFLVGSRSLSLDCRIFNIRHNHETFTSWTIRYKWQLGLHGSEYAQWRETCVTYSQISTKVVKKCNEYGFIMVSKRRQLTAIFWPFPQRQGGHCAVCGWTNTRVVFAMVWALRHMTKTIITDRDECVRSRHGCAQHYGQNHSFCEYMSLGRQTQRWQWESRWNEVDAAKMAVMYGLPNPGYSIGYWRSTYVSPQPRPLKRKRPVYLLINPSRPWQSQTSYVWPGAQSAGVHTRCPSNIVRKIQ